MFVCRGPFTQALVSADQQQNKHAPLQRKSATMTFSGSLVSRYVAGRNGDAWRWLICATQPRWRGTNKMRLKRNRGRASGGSDSVVDLATTFLPAQHECKSTRWRGSKMAQWTPRMQRAGLQRKAAAGGVLLQGAWSAKAIHGWPKSRGKEEFATRTLIAVSATGGFGAALCTHAHGVGTECLQTGACCVCKLGQRRRCLCRDECCMRLRVGRARAKASGCVVYSV